MQNSEDRKKLKPEYRSDSTLIKDLREQKNRMDDEAEIRTLDDVVNVEEIADFLPITIRRLCKVHQIKR